MRPDSQEQRGRRGELAPATFVLRASQQGLVTRQSSVVQESGESLGIVRFGMFGLVERLGNRGHQLQDREAGALLTARRSPDAVGDHCQRGEPLDVQLALLRFVDTSSIHTHGACERTREVVILVVGTNLAWVREPPHIDIRELWPLSHPTTSAAANAERRRGEGFVASGNSRGLRHSLYSRSPKSRFGRWAKPPPQARH